MFAEPYRSNGNIGQNIVLNQLVVDQNSFESIYKITAVPDGNGWHDITFEVPMYLFDDKNKVKEKETCEDYFGLTPTTFVWEKSKWKEVDNPEYLDCRNFLVDIETGLSQEAKLLKEDKTIIGEVVGQKSKVKIKVEKGKDKAVKFGDNSIEIYFADGLVSTTVTPETIEPKRKSGEFYEYWHPVVIDNNGVGQIDVSRENFLATGIGYSIWTDNVFYTTEPLDTNCWTIIDEEFGEVEKCDFYRLSDGNINWDYNYLEPHIIKVPVKRVEGTDINGNTIYYPENFITISAGESRTFYYKYYSKEKKGKWDFVFSYDGTDYMIDPFWSNSVDVDLEHDYSFNGWVKQISEGTHLDSWTWTNELDWNADGDYSVDGSSWDTNLVAYYKFDDGTADDSARGYDGTLTNGASVDAYGMWDTNALSLDGTNDYVDLVTNPDLRITSDLTISAWIKCANSNQANTYNHIFASYDASGYNGYAIAITRGQLLAFYTDTGGWTISTNDVCDGKWHFVSTVLDGSTVYYYVDGVTSNSDTTNTPSASTAKQTIGSRYDGTYNFGGQIDGLKIYDRALTQEEILADYNSFLEAKFVDNNVYGDGTNSDWNAIKINSDLNYSFNKELCGNADTDCNADKFNNGLVGLWHMNDKNSDNWTYDASGNDNKGTLLSNAHINNTCLWGTKCLYCDGGHDRVRIPYNSIFNFSSTGFTTSAWIYSLAYDGGYDNSDIIGKDLTTGTRDWALSAYDSTGTTADAELALIIRDEEGDYLGVSSPEILLTNRWHHVVATYEGGVTIASIEVYVDGFKQPKSDLSSGSFGTMVTTTNDLWIGTRGALTDFHGYIEDVSLWNYPMSEEEVRDLYRKGVSRLDLNVVSCSDASCATETGSEYFTDINNNVWNYFTTLPNSNYLKWEGLFRTNETDFSDRNAGFFHVGALLNDVNIEYESVVAEPTIFGQDFNVYKTGTSTHLTNINFDCDIDAYDLTLQNSPFSQDMNAGTYECIFSTTGYDSNTLNFTVDANAERIVYLKEYNLITFNVRDTNGNHLTNWNMDINVGTDLVGANSPTSQNMVNGSYQGIFSKTGYDSNTIEWLVEGSDINVNVTLSLVPTAQADINFVYPRESGGIVKANITEFYLKTTNGFIVTDANYTLNNFSTIDLNTECTDWNTSNVYCNLTALSYSTLYDNNLEVCLDTNDSTSYCETISFNYNPNLDLIIPGGDDSLIYLVLLMVLGGGAILFLMYNTKKREV